MTREPKKDLAASIRQRLQNIAEAGIRPVQEVFEYFVMERFLYRLSQSPQADKFVLKGALLFTAWDVARSRATRDIDLLAHTANNQAAIADICRQTLPEETTNCRQKSPPSVGIRLRSNRQLSVGIARRIQLQVG